MLGLKPKAQALSHTYLSVPHAPISATMSGGVSRKHRDGLRGERLWYELRSELTKLQEIDSGRRPHASLVPPFTPDLFQNVASGRVHHLQTLRPDFLPNADSHAI